MRVVIAPDSFKESIGAHAAAEAIAEGFLRVCPKAQTQLFPMADGGEGTLDAILSSSKGKKQSTRVTAPLGNSVDAQWALYGAPPTAVIEMAEASGLHLVSPDQRDPWVTSSRGCGELIKAALDAGCRHFLIGIGGSATNDGGMGALSALGFRFLDASGSPVGPGARGLSQLASIDLSTKDPRLDECQFDIATDVKNPLTGPHGASHIYASQKGAKAEELDVLDKALAHFADSIAATIGRDPRNEEGAGAAGGIGAGFSAFLGAKLRPGAELIAQMLGLEHAMSQADLVITGEGQINAQSSYGKVIVTVAQEAKKSNVPVIALAGSLGEGYRIVFKEGIDAVECLCDGPRSLEYCLKNSRTLLADAAERIARLWCLH